MDVTQLLKGSIAAGDGLHEVLEIISQWRQVKSCVLQINEPGGVGGVIGLKETATNGNWFMTGALLSSGEFGRQALRQILRTCKGNFVVLNTGTDPLPELRQGLRIDVESILPFIPHDISNNDTPSLFDPSESTQTIATAQASDTVSSATPEFWQQLVPTEGAVMPQQSVQLQQPPPVPEAIFIEATPASYPPPLPVIPAAETLPDTVASEDTSESEQLPAPAAPELSTIVSSPPIEELSAEEKLVQGTNRLVSNVLRIGLQAACLTTITGAVIHLKQHPDFDLNLAKFHGEPENLRTIVGIVKLALAGDGLGIMQTGVLILLATPFLRVIFAGLAFTKQRDWKFVVISLLVLGLLIYGLCCGRTIE